MDSAHARIKSALPTLRMSDAFNRLKRLRMVGYLGWYFSKLKDDEGREIIVTHQRGDLKATLEEQALVNQYAQELCNNAAKILFG